MNKFYTKIKKGMNKEKENIKKYAVTLITILISTLIVTILSFEEEYAKLYLSLVFINVLVFIVDTLFTDKKKKYLMYILSFVLAIISAIIIVDNNMSTKEIVALIGIYPTLFSLAIYKLATEETLPKFLNKVVGNNIIFNIALSILQAGLMFSTLIIMALFSAESEIIIRVEILFLGLFAIPGELLCITSKNSIMPEKFMKGLIKYIELPVILLINVIIYIYLLKIVVTLNIPSNEIFKIVAGLFSVGFPTWILIENFKNNDKFLEKISKYLPVAFIPLILMQIYSLLLRIASRGLTITRYLGAYIIFFEVVVVVYAILKEDINKTILYGAGIIFVTLSMPFLNVYDVAYTSQLNRLEKIYYEGVNFDNLSETKKKEIKNIYNYINYSLHMKEKLPGYIEKEKIEKYNEYYYEPEEKYENIDYENNNDSVNITGYDLLIPIDMYEFADNSGQIDDLDFYDIAPENMTEHNEIVELIKPFFKKVMADGRVDVPKNGIIKLDQGSALYIKSLNISYKKSTNEINHINFNGYYLQKNIEKSDEN